MCCMVCQEGAKRLVLILLHKDSKPSACMSTSEVPPTVLPCGLFSSSQLPPLSIALPFSRGQLQPLRLQLYPLVVPVECHARRFHRFTLPVAQRSRRLDLTPQRLGAVEPRTFLPAEEAVTSSNEVIPQPCIFTTRC